MSQKFIFTTVKLRKVHPPNKEVIKGLSLSFFHGAKIGVLGHNGSGKSTLLRIMAGEDKDFLGEAFAAEGTRIGYLPQEPQLDPDKTVREEVEAGVGEIKALVDRFEEIGELMGQDPPNMDELLEEYGELQNKIEAADAWELDRTLERAMDALRLPPGDAKCGPLSGGEARRVALCKLLLEKPDMLLLDEPTNHLDAESVAWLERFLEEYPGTVVAVTHDRYFLDNVAGWILELENGHGYPYEGNYSGWLEQKQKRLELQEKASSSRKRTLQRELEWIRMSPKARQAKGKARLNAYESLLAEDGSAVATFERELGADHEESIRTRGRLATLLNARGRFAEAGTALASELERARRVLGSDHAVTLSLVAEVAYLDSRLARYDRAERGYLRVRDHRRRVHGPDHLATIRADMNLARYLRDVGRLDDAERILRRCLVVRTEQLGPAHTATLTCAGDLTRVLVMKGDLAGAEAIGPEALGLALERLGEDASATAGLLGCVAFLDQARGRYEEAATRCRQILALRRRLLGEDHRATFTAMNELANACLNLGRRDEARQLLQTALAGFERVLGEDHPDAAKPRTALARMDLFAGRTESAVELFGKCHRDLVGAFGRDHPDTLTSLADVAWARQVFGDLEGAARDFEKVMTSRRRVLGEEHPHTLLVTNQYAEVLAAMRRFDVAAPLLERALEAQLRVHGESHPDTLWTLANLGWVHRARGELDLAESFYRRTFEGRVEIHGAAHENTIRAQVQLGNLLGQLERLDEARAILASAHESALELGESHPISVSATARYTDVLVELGDHATAEPLLLSLVEALQGPGGRGGELALVRGRLAELYERWGRPEDAARYR